MRFPDIVLQEWLILHYCRFLQYRIGIFTICQKTVRSKDQWNCCYLWKGPFRNKSIFCSFYLYFLFGLSKYHREQNWKVKIMPNNVEELTTFMLI
jgi:hypothetical protein